MDNKIVLKWNEVEPLCLIRLLVRKAWLLVLAALIGVLGAATLLTCTRTQVYTSSVTFAVTARSNSSLLVNTTTASTVARIYSELLESEVMGDAIQGMLGNEQKGTIQAAQLGETNLIQLTVTADTPKAALLTVQAIMENYGELSDYVSSSAVLSALNTPSVAVRVTNIRDMRSTCMLFAAVCGGLMLVTLVWLFLTNGTVQNQVGAKHYLDTSILASVPRDSQMAKQSAQKHTRKRMNITSPVVSFAFSEAINRVAARLEHEKIAGRQVFLFTSVSEGEGKSTVAANTALSLAMKRQRVLLIDLDLRRPVQHQILSIAPENDLGKLLSEGRAGMEVLDCAQQDEYTGLWALVNGKAYPDAVELLGSRGLAETIAVARGYFDFVIVDLPPIGYFSESELVSDLCDGSVLVVRQDEVPAMVINDAIDDLRSGSAEFLGCVLNDMRHLYAGGSGYAYGYGYGYGGKNANPYEKYDTHRSSGSKNRL